MKACCSGGSGAHERLELVAPLAEFCSRADDELDSWFIVAVEEPAAVFENTQHQPLPDLSPARIVGSRSETRRLVVYAV